MSVETNQMYLKAIQLEKENKEEAFSYYLQVARASHVQAIAKLARIYAQESEYGLE